MKFTSLLNNYRWYIVSAVVLTMVYFASRLINLTDIPIFTDEAIYIRWAQIGGRDASWRYISLTDGKQPLFVWVMMATVRLFSDPLFAGRIVSVGAGFLSLIGIAILAYELFRKKSIALFASLLYLTSPFALMYDRLALMDSLLATFSIWSLFLAIRLVKTGRLDMALLLGMSLGGGVLTKTSGFISIYLLPATLLLFNFHQKEWKLKFAKLIGLMLVATMFSQAYYSILRLSPWFHMVEQKDSTFVFPIKQWLIHPFRFFVSNLYSALEWMGGYLTIPLIILIIIALFVDYKSIRRKTHLLLTWSIFSLLLTAIFVLWKYLPFLGLNDLGRTMQEKPIMFVFISAAPWVVISLMYQKWWQEKTLLLIWSLAPLFGLSLFGKVLYPRFIFFMAMPLLILAAWGLSYITHSLGRYKKYVILIPVIFMIYPVYVQAKILYSALTAPIPQADLNQYLNDIYSGWGVREVNATLETLAQDQEITVFTDGTFGLMPYAIEIYLIDHPRIRIKGIFPSPANYSDDMNKEIRQRPTYYVSNQLQELPKYWNVELINEWQKGISDGRYLRLYRLYPQKQKQEIDEEIPNQAL
ncbi:glycosyltransferase family 39 protein [Candidatus Roizmanbacteria bacterium]|nr:glycosyltransferase family 39 protein [Candidatus Roizmanbacteria bacterium]